MSSKSIRFPIIYSKIKHSFRFNRNYGDDSRDSDGYQTLGRFVNKFEMNNSLFNIQSNYFAKKYPFFSI